MALINNIQNYVSSLSGELKEAKGIYEMTVLVAQRKAFLATQKLQYTAKFRILDDHKLVRYSEMLKESASGVSAGGDFDSSPGFGFKSETYKTGGAGREGTIEQQSALFGKKYTYTFDFANIRKKIGELAKAEGYQFELKLTAREL